jgi:cytochrome b involved in lipid metabolism
MKHKIITFLVIAFVIIFGITLLMNSGSAIKTPAYSNTDTLPATQAGKLSTPEYTLAQVQAHSSSLDCWTIVGSNVYDLTSFISQHPGGQETILSICGKDGTAAFEGQHGGQRRPANELQSLEIGVYKN